MGIDSPGEHCNPNRDRLIHDISVLCAHQSVTKHAQMLSVESS